MLSDVRKEPFAIEAYILLLHLDIDISLYIPARGHTFAASWLHDFLHAYGLMRRNKHRGMCTVNDKPAWMDLSHKSLSGDQIVRGHAIQIRFGHEY